MKINEDDPAVKVINNDVQFGFIQLGTTASVGVAGDAYEWMRPSQAEQDWLKQRDELMELDLQTAVHDPSLPVISQTAVEKGATLGLIPTDARIKYLAGALTEDEFKAEIKRWYDSGGTQILAELQDGISKIGG
ncbi:hypothetical protein ACFSTC_23650 [Nonomuraea ferruginea]